MIARLASLAFLLDAAAIGLGAFGHGLEARHLHAATDQFPIDPNVHSMLYVVWYFVSGCMFTFGLLLVWAWRRMRAGDSQPFAVAAYVGVLYVGVGVFGLVYRQGDLFMTLFIVLGGILLLSGYVMSRPLAPGVHVRHA